MKYYFLLNERNWNISSILIGLKYFNKAWNPLCVNARTKTQNNPISSILAWELTDRGARCGLPLSMGLRLQSSGHDWSDLAGGSAGRNFKVQYLIIKKHTHTIWLCGTSKLCEYCKIVHVKTDLLICSLVNYLSALYKWYSLPLKI